MAETSKITNFPVYSQRLAGHLMTQGFILIAVAPNERNSRKNVFFFKDTSMIKSSIQDYLDGNR